MAERTAGPAVPVEAETAEKELYNDIYQYVTVTGPSKFRAGLSKDDKKITRRRAKNFVNRDGQLYLIAKGEKGAQKGKERQWIAGKAEQRRILQSCHDDSLGKLRES